MSNFDSAQSALAMAENLRQAVANKYIEANGITINLTASVGVVKYQQLNLAELIAQAGKQLYKAKDAGRNAVFSDINLCRCGLIHLIKIRNTVLPNRSFFANVFTHGIKKQSCSYR